jgi:hypothetical protein
MKKITQIQESLKIEKAKVISKLDETNKYLTFAKGYYKKHGVSGPFDEKFKSDKKAQKKFMDDLGKAWEEHKEKHGIVTKSEKPWGKKK